MELGNKFLDIILESNLEEWWYKIKNSEHRSRSISKSSEINHAKLNFNETQFYQFDDTNCLNKNEDVFVPKLQIEKIKDFHSKLINLI